MAKKRITSKHGLFGMVYHYDENGKCVGKSRPGLLGDRKIHYDADGRQVGTSRPGFFSEEVHYDAKNKRYISSYRGLTGMIHRSNGRTVGKTTPGLFDTRYSTFEEDDTPLEDYADEELFDYDEDFSDFEDEIDDFDAEDEEEDEAAPIRKEEQTGGTGKHIVKKVVGVFCVLGLLVFIGLTASALSKCDGKITSDIAPLLFGCVIYAVGIFFCLIRKPKNRS